MMEFTYEGMVRYGFGFYNPNHAAALICALMPFLWAAWGHWRHVAFRIGVGVAMLLLMAALAMTYSRSGFLILAAEVGVFFLLTKSKNWKLALGILAAGLVVCIAGGVAARFVLDKSVTNRFDIYLAGLRLFAWNPLGVGFGNSGAVASAFLLPERIVCRTLVNSHLTLLTEFGIVAGGVWFGAIIYALLNGTKKPAAYAAFTGLLLAAGCASIFDWDVLFDFRAFGELTVLNYILSWLLLFYFIGLAVYLSWGRVRRTNLLITGVSVLFLMFSGLSFALLPGPETPCIVGREFAACSKTKPQILVLYDNSCDLRAAKNLVSRHWPEYGAVIPLQTWHLRNVVPEFGVDKVLLIGKCSDFAERFPQSEVILYMPSEYHKLTGNIREIHIPPFNPGYRELKASAEALDIRVCESGGVY